MVLMSCFPFISHKSKHSNWSSHICEVLMSMQIWRTYWYPNDHEKELRSFKIAVCKLSHQENADDLQQITLQETRPRLWMMSGPDFLRGQYVSIRSFKNVEAIRPCPHCWTISQKAAFWPLKWRNFTLMIASNGDLIFHVDFVVESFPALYNMQKSDGQIQRYGFQNY